MTTDRFESDTDEFTNYPPMGKVASLVEYIEMVQKNLSHKKTLFRGQSRTWPLRPGIDRLRNAIVPGENKYHIPNDKALLEHFKRLSWPLFPQAPDDDDTWAWLALAQHHGLPTRMIDWSISSLVALWFAVAEFNEDSHPEKAGDGGPCVWLLEADTKLWVTKSTETPFEVSGLRVYAPPIVTPRLRAQRGVFTVAKIQEKRGSMENIARNNKDTGKIGLKYLTIERGACLSIIDDLRKQGFDESTIYPDLEGTSAFLKRIAKDYANGRDPMV